jgi:hypothetical protein
MSMNYNDYRAAVERLLRVESGESVHEVYAIRDNDYAAWKLDKAIIYDAEHDQAPATVEWLREVGFEHYAGVECPTYELGPLRATLISGVLVLCHGNSFRLSDNPTRGDVLTALRLFSKKEGA